MTQEKPTPAWWQIEIAKPTDAAMNKARQRQEQLTKPPGSLGQLENLAVQFAGWQNSEQPAVERVAVRIFAADHGVVSEGVSAFPQVVTAEMVRNFARGGAAICVLSRQMDADFAVLNMGTVTELEPLPGVTNVQLAAGTENFCQTAAMSESVVAEALQAGADSVVDADLFIGGEMGIGNTTAAAALTSQLLGLPPLVTVGRGTGVDDQGWARKRNAVQRALDLHSEHLHSEHCQQPLEILRRLGGLEIAALVGAYISAAQRSIPSLVDGYICSAAALVACRLKPAVRDWLLFAHRSAEPGHRHILEHLQAEPLLDFGMRLGEGSGAAVAVPLLRSACQLHNQMATFAEASVSDGQQ
ncbi:nicotinate-nucleotide--dimethylbenzimidazole phosphoribosyltransferase [Porticoccus sp. W117]|uniref:nicotinate-nucleotide--dimethylbenzimidazole phosphoribosyltransferase n=1 Tax=Porticoccus sp. W117 TaxID=3054777 RepID=UPI0025932FFF|nr:nicotinate-nucleotide--dimethylbenzimidazole phosphoribosyltransferase [Porticoccus sp. W117]MDM3871415.1 nicotinate-nucleotide--dimethylbenzimidazole phosphoribosyltransferase [Porticoccus sp. W117]